MQQEIINYPFDEIDNDDRERSDSFEQSSEEVSMDRPNIPDTEITNVNGHNLPEDEDDDEEDDTEDDLILGDEDELDEADFDEDEIDVEVDEDVDNDVSDDDLVLDTEEDVDDEDEL